MTRRRTYLGAHKIRRTFAGVPYREWAIAIPAGILIVILGWAVLVASVAAS